MHVSGAYLRAVSLYICDDIRLRYTITTAHTHTPHKPPSAGPTPTPVHIYFHIYGRLSIPPSNLSLYCCISFYDCAVQSVVHMDVCVCLSTFVASQPTHDDDIDASTTPTPSWRCVVCREYKYFYRRVLVLQTLLALLPPPHPLLPPPPPHNGRRSRERRTDSGGMVLL